MEIKEVNIKKSELIPLLIEYKKILGKTFPIDKVKYLSNEQIILKIKKCIDLRQLYQSQIFKLDNMQKLSNYELSKLFNLIKESMDKIDYDYKTNIAKYNEFYLLRKNGKVYNFEEHIKALILTQLNNNRWGDSNIKKNDDKLNIIFNNYDRNFLKNIECNDIFNKLKKIHCTNLSTIDKIKSIPYNVKILENIEKEYGTLDKYILNNEPNDIANCFCEGKYKLKQVGKSITFDYLKRVGISCSKSSSKLQKLFGAKRLGVVDNENATNMQVISIIKKLSYMTGLNEFEVECILEQFCSFKCSNICVENPNCKKCLLKRNCNFKNTLKEL